MNAGVIQAIEVVAEVVRRTRGVANPERRARQIAALERVATVTRSNGLAAVERGLATIGEAMIAPMDPSAIGWNVFRLFETADSETKWTTWLCSILSPENGPELSALMWRSIVDAVVDRGCEPTICHPDEEGVLANLDYWRTARAITLPPGSVDHELADAGLGARTDIVINAPEFYVVIENKLEAGWHDGEERQAVRYRKFGLKYRSKKRLGLVLLTNRTDFRLDAECADYVRIEYRDVARALRRNLRSVLGSQPPAVISTLAIGPALLTVAAIEQDLLGLDIAQTIATARKRGWRAIEALNEIVDYLREER